MQINVEEFILIKQAITKKDILHYFLRIRQVIKLKVKYIKKIETEEVFYIDQYSNRPKNTYNSNTK